MPVTVPQNFIEQIEKEKADSEFLWLWQLWGHDGAGGVEPVVVQLANAAADVWWGGMQFHAYPITQSPVVEDAQGNFPSIDVVLGDVGGLLMRYLQGVNGVRYFVGQEATAWLVNRSNLGAANYSRFDFLIDTWASNVSRNAVALRLQLPNWFRVITPTDRFHAQICDAQFGNMETGCPYIVNSFAAFTSCNQTLNDCKARGADMVNRNLPPLLPQMFGAFPGVGNDRTP